MYLPKAVIPDTVLAHTAARRRIPRNAKMSSLKEEVQYFRDIATLYLVTGLNLAT